MERYLSRRIKILSVILVILFIIIGVAILARYPFGVRQYKTITLGMSAAEGADSHTTWAPPYDRVWKSDFYVYALGDETMCIGSDCGMGGNFVECLGGWLSGDKVRTEEFDYGLRDAGVDFEKQTIITVANEDAKIIGIYPGAKIRNLPYIMRNHRDLVSDDIFEACWGRLPRRWK